MLFYLLFQPFKKVEVLLPPVVFIKSLTLVPVRCMENFHYLFGVYFSQK